MKTNKWFMLRTLARQASLTVLSAGLAFSLAGLYPFRLKACRRLKPAAANRSKGLIPCMAFQTPPWYIRCQDARIWLW